VEKTMGFKESRLALILGYILESYLEHHDLGIVLGADGMLRLNPTLVRIPDISFISWDQLPGRKYPEEKVPLLHPDLAVEVLSASNTPAEMEQKLRDYFAAGARLVWYLDPVDRSGRVYTAPGSMKKLDESGVLEGGDVLPGFELVIADWFRRALRPGRNP
jgi:Uma2 family endonuclease